MDTPQNPYLSGNFAPVRDELEAENLRVLGALPPGLEGVFVRNGPNPRFQPRGRYHWFDGDGMLHAVELKGGRASYRNRYVETRGLELERAAGRAVFGGLLEPPDFENPEGPFKNAANTALAWHAGRLLATWEGGPPHEIRLPGLETVGLHDFAGRLDFPFTAHPKLDPETGELLFFGYSLVEEPYLRYGVVSAEGQIKHTIPVALPLPVMMHDFAITARYTIFLDLPMVFRLERAMEGAFPLAFERELPARFGVLPRHGQPGDIRWFEGPACYIWHTLNAHEEGEEIVLTGCRVSETNLLLPAPGESRPPEDPRLHQWRLNLATGSLREAQLDDTTVEFPRINERYLGREARYGYAGRGADADTPRFDGAVKYDLKTGRKTTHSLGPGRSSGEWVFAPREGASAEDDGWLMSYVYDEAEGRSELVILDAKELSAPPVARVLLPRRVPYGFHGAWIPAAAYTRGA